MDEGMSPMSDASLSAGEILLRLTASATLAAGALLYGAGSATLSTLTLGTAGRVLVAGASAPAWSDAGLSYASGVLAIAGSVPGTPSAGQVLIGGGAGKFGGALSCTTLTASLEVTPGFRSAYLTGADQGCFYQSDGSAWTGTPAAAQYGWGIFQSRSSAYTGNRGFIFASGASPAAIATLYDNGCLRLGATGAAIQAAGAAGSLQTDGAITAGGVITTNGGQVTIQGVASPFIVLSDGTRASYVEQVSGHIRFTPPADREIHFIGGSVPGTPGATECRFGGGAGKFGAGVTCTALTTTANGQVFSATGAGTSTKFLQISNTTGNVYLGVESDTAGAVFTGSYAWESVLYTSNGGVYLSGTYVRTTGQILTSLTTEATTGGAGSIATSGGIYAAKKIITNSTADGAMTTAGKITAKAAVPGSFASLADVQSYLASILT